MLAARLWVNFADHYRKVASAWRIRAHAAVGVWYKPRATLQAAVRVFEFLADTCRDSGCRSRDNLLPFLALFQHTQQGTRAKEDVNEFAGLGRAFKKI